MSLDDGHEVSIGIESASLWRKDFRVFEVDDGFVNDVVDGDFVVVLWKNEKTGGVFSPKKGCYLVLGILNFGKQKFRIVEGVDADHGFFVHVDGYKSWVGGYLECLDGWADANFGDGDEFDGLFDLG